MNTFRFTGIIKQIKDPEQITDRFKKRELWLDYPDEKRPQVLCFEFANKTCELLDDFGVGQEVTVTFSLKGREHKGRIYNTLGAFEIRAESRKEPRPLGATQGNMTNWDKSTDDDPF